MQATPIVFRTVHRAKFDDLDPNGHMNTSRYVSYFMDNRFEGHRRHFDLDLKAILQLPFAIYTKAIAFEFMRPVFADSEFTIVSHVDEFQGSTAIVKAELLNHKGIKCATCTMTLVCIDKTSAKPTEWPSEFMSRFFV